MLFHADGRTDRRMAMTKLIVAFRNFANTPKTGDIKPKVSKSNTRNVKGYSKYSGRSRP